MADDFIQGQPDGTGKKVDTDRLTVGANEVHRQRSVVADPTVAGGLARVLTTAPGAADPGLVTRNIPSGQQNTLLTSPNGAAAGLFATLTAYGNQRVTPEPNVVFSDGFDGATIDTTDRWNTATGTVSQTGGSLAIGNTTVSTVHNLVSRVTFPPLGLNLYALAFVLTTEATPLATNVARFFGFGVHTGTPTTTQPVTDGVGFEFDGAGKLWAAVWVNGARHASSVDLSARAVAGPTRYSVIWRIDAVFFYIGSTEVPVASISFATPATQTLPIRLQQVNGATVTGTPSTAVQGVAVHDTGRNAAMLSDAGAPWRRAGVTAKGVQGAFALATQDLKDAGRARVSIVFQGTAPATADTLLSLTKITDGVAGTAATSIGVAAGKRLRLEAITFSLKANAAAAAFATLTLRQNPTAATAIGSVSEQRIDLGNTEAVIGAARAITVPLPDGFEFSGAQTLGVSLAAQATTNIVSIALTGFEY